MTVPGTTPEEAVVLWAAATPEVVAVFGDRIYPYRAPTAPTFPYVVVQVLDEFPAADLVGEVDLAVVDLDLAAWGRTTKEAQDGARVLRQHLSGLRGDTWGTWAVRRVILRDFDTRVEQRDDGSQAVDLACAWTAEVWYKDETALALRR